MDDIAAAIARCRQCKVDKIGVAVPGEGNADADVMFIGEAPGKNEAATGRPFIGRSGQLLRRHIREAGFTEEEVYITSPVKYLPKRGTPDAGDIAHGRTHLSAQVAVINPKVMVLLGNTACKAVLEESKKVLKDHGTLIKKDGRTYMIMLHPAAVIRFPKYASIFSEDFRTLARLTHS